MFKTPHRAVANRPQVRVQALCSERLEEVLELEYIAPVCSYPASPAATSATFCVRKYSAVVVMMLLACASLVVTHRVAWFRAVASPAPTFGDSAFT